MKGLPHFYDLITFLSEHDQALISAAELLGGASWYRRALRLLNQLHSSDVLTRRAIQDLEALRDLLALENVGDCDRDEAGFFASIDPSDPRVAEICLLSERLSEVCGNLQPGDRLRSSHQVAA